MDVRVLGAITATSCGEAVAISANQRLLVALLTARVGDVVAADALIDGLWEDRLPANPRASLQSVVSRLRSRLDPTDHSALITRPPGYVLSSEHTTVDKVDFERIIEQARNAGDGEEAIEQYDRALSLWRGIPYEEFAHVQALREDGAWLEELHALASEERLALLLRVDPAAVVGELEAMVAAFPYRERPHALLMEALHRSNRQRDALSAFARYRTMLLHERGLDPSAAIRALEQSILTDSLEPLPPLTPVRTRPETRHNLVARRTTFIGRQQERSEVAAGLMRDRLTTLVGAGGVGKTSLSAEVARDALADFDHGTYVVDLLQLSEGDAVADHVAATVGLPPLDTERPVAALVERLDGRQMLIVLDNCEHVVDAVAEVVSAVLDGDNAVRLLATSREPLRVQGEVIHRLGPLEVPDPGASIDAVLTSPSGRLFIERVLAADRSFRSDAADGAVISSICESLDGLPLALELAAARVPALGLRQVADRLDDRLGLLNSNQRDGVPHHQTLRAAIAWSVDLLDDRQRLLLARLSVFVGGFDLPAAEAVCADGVLEVKDIADELASLVERSLVVAFRHDGSVRYRLLETIREYASIELAGDVDANRDRHRAYYSDLARAIGDGFLVNTTLWYRRLRTEFPNLRAAFRWTFDHGEVAAALDLAAALRWSPFNTGYLYREHREWIDRALAAARVAGVDPALLARGIVAAGSVAGLEGRSNEAVALLEEAVVILDRQRVSDEVIWAQMWLGAFCADLGDYQTALDATKRGVAAAEALGSPVGIIYLSNQEAEVAQAAFRLGGEPRYEMTAKHAFDRAIRLASEYEVEEGLVRAEHGLALHVAPDQPSTSLGACEAALIRWRELGAGNRLVLGLVCTARVALLAGDHPRAATLVRESADTMVQVGWFQPLGRLVETAAVLSAHVGDHRAAARLAGAASERFLTPRWYVPIGAVECFEQLRHVDTGIWDALAADGRALSDAETLALMAAITVPAT
jgi:predicted ATPase/DNA-binding SARP family transcriptional activator